MGKIDINIDNVFDENDILLEKYAYRLFLGIVIYTISATVLVGIIPGVIINLIQLTGLAFFFFYWKKLASFNNISSNYLKYTICLFFLWIIYIIYHGFIFSYPYMKEYLFDKYRALHYFVPLVVFLPVAEPAFLRNILKFSYKLGLVFLIGFLPLFYFLISDQGLSEQYVWTFATGCGFILLTSYYQTKKKIILSAIVVFLALVLMTIMARRNLMLTYAGFLVASFYIYLFFNKIAFPKKVIAVLLSVFFLIGCFYFFVSNQAGVFSGITERATADTRETVFFDYFMDMASEDWMIAGKGINGTYYCPGIDAEWGSEELGYRDIDDRIYIECGYLQLILNGGLVYLILYLAVFLPAIVKGFFFSDNVFSKACATVLVLWLIDMFPFGLPSFTFRYFLVWFCVAFCYSKKIRSMDNEEVKEIIS